MKSGIVAGGRFRFYESDGFRKRLRELHETIEARYAGDLATAGFLRRVWLRWKMARELRRERKSIEPSPESLFGRD